jgi:small subunit ribosomal protein S9
MSLIQYYGTGRRKRATARVYLRPGDGTITVNRKSLDVFFPNDVLKMLIRQPMVTAEVDGKFDLVVNVQGGGSTGQAGAIRHGIARALCDYNSELRPRLKENGFLTRDARIKERKKYGQKGARARFQFSKR